MRRAVIQIRKGRKDADLVTEMGRRFVAALHSEIDPDPAAIFTFSSSAQLFSVVNPKRWELIEHLQSIGASSIGALAASLCEDLPQVQDDVDALVDWGILERTEEGKISVPYDVIHIDFDISAAA